MKQHQRKSMKQHQRKRKRCAVWAMSLNIEGRKKTQLSGLHRTQQSWTGTFLDKQVNSFLKCHYNLPLQTSFLSSGSLHIYQHSNSDWLHFCTSITLFLVLSFTQQVLACEEEFKFLRRSQRTKFILPYTYHLAMVRAMSKSYDPLLLHSIGNCEVLEFWVEINLVNDSPTPNCYSESLEFLKSSDLEPEFCTTQTAWV